MSKESIAAELKDMVMDSFNSGTVAVCDSLISAIVDSVDNLETTVSWNNVIDLIESSKDKMLNTDKRLN